MLLAWAASGALCANAQTPEPDTHPTWRADEIIVVEKLPLPYGADDAALAHMPVPLDEIPQSIQVLAPTLLEEQELNTLSNALLNVSGVDRFQFTSAADAPESIDPELGEPLHRMLTTTLFVTRQAATQRRKTQ